MNEQANEPDGRRRVFRDGDTFLDQLDARVRRFKGLLAMAGFILLPFLTSLTNKLVAGSLPVTDLQAQQRKTASKDSTQDAMLELLRSDLNLHRAEEKASRESLQLGVRVLLQINLCNKSDPQTKLIRVVLVLDCAAPVPSQ